MKCNAFQQMIPHFSDSTYKHLFMLRYTDEDQMEWMQELKYNISSGVRYYIHIKKLIHHGHTQIKSVVVK